MNLLVDSRYSIRVADFGLGKLKDVQKANTRMGTVNWVAPEILRETEPYTEKSDVFSFSMVDFFFFTFHTFFLHFFFLGDVGDFD